MTSIVSSGSKKMEHAKSSSLKKKKKKKLKQPSKKDLIIKKNLEKKSKEKKQKQKQTENFKDRTKMVELNVREIVLCSTQLMSCLKDREFRNRLNKSTHSDGTRKLFPYTKFEIFSEEDKQVLLRSNTKQNIERAKEAIQRMETWHIEYSNHNQEELYRKPIVFIEESDIRNRRIKFEERLKDIYKDNKSLLKGSNKEQLQETSIPELAKELAEITSEYVQGEIDNIVDKSLEHATQNENGAIDLKSISDLLQYVPSVSHEIKRVYINFYTTKALLPWSQEYIPDLIKKLDSIKDMVRKKCMQKEDVAKIKEELHRKYQPAYGLTIKRGGYSKEQLSSISKMFPKLKELASKTFGRIQWDGAYGSVKFKLGYGLLRKAHYRTNKIDWESNYPNYFNLMKNYTEMRKIIHRRHDSVEMMPVDKTNVFGAVKEKGLRKMKGLDEKKQLCT